jgi:hypothetical protein
MNASFSQRRESSCAKKPCSVDRNQRPHLSIAKQRSMRVAVSFVMVEHTKCDRGEADNCSLTT